MNRCFGSAARSVACGPVLRCFSERVSCSAPLLSLFSYRPTVPRSGTETPKHLFNPVLRIILRGRTGNILFQYALGRALAAKHGVPLVLDASWYNRQGWSEVSHFLKLPIQAKVLRPFLLASLASRALRNYAGKHYWELLGVPALRESREDQSFDRKFVDAPGDCMLSGFFQSPLYFQGTATALRSELNSLFTNAIHVTDGLRAQLTKTDSVAVHVRRGDYLEIPAFQVCGDDYFRKSMDEMRVRLPAARFLVFSDDPEWCRGRFQDSDTEVIDSQAAEKNPLHDLHLMSLASHHIIANSSYSWWAAWLGDKAGQQVIMPERWYASEIVAPIEEKRLPHWTIAR